MVVMWGGGVGLGAGLRREIAAARVAKIVSQLRGVFLCCERRAPLTSRHRVPRESLLFGRKMDSQLI
jgi:hypothetical protein